MSDDEDDSSSDEKTGSVWVLPKGGTLALRKKVVAIGGGMIKTATSHGTPNPVQPVQSAGSSLLWTQKATSPEQYTYFGTRSIDYDPWTDNIEIRTDRLPPTEAPREHVPERSSHTLVLLAVIAILICLFVAYRSDLF
jgi:hypothetical protein